MAMGIRRAVEAADAVIVPSSATKSDLVAWFKLPARKVRVVPLAAGECFLPLPSQEVIPVLRRHRLPVRGYILFAGNIEPRKNLARLVEAYNILRKETRLTPLLVLVGGGGWKNQPIHRAIRASPFATDIKLLGYVSDEEISALMNGAALFSYPSIYEGFGIPPLEAMACGTPVVASNASSLSEVVGDAALLVDPSDVTGLAAAMVRILQDQTLREDLRERGFKQARQFSWEETARLTVQVYESAGASA